MYTSSSMLMSCMARYVRIARSGSTQREMSAHYLRKLSSPLPVVVWTGHNTNDHLPRHGRAAIAIQNNLPVVCSMGEDDVCTHAHPEGVLTNTHCETIVADLCTRVLQVCVPQKTCGVE